MFRKIIYGISGLLLSVISYAQSPDMYPPPVPERIDINLFNLILYILLPIGLIIAYLWYQKSQRKKRQNKKEDKK